MDRLPVIPWHALTPADALSRLGVSLADGLTEDEAARRLALGRPNRLDAVGTASWGTVLVRQFADVLIAILAVAAVLALLVGEISDAVTIVAILVLNGGLGFVQEWRAARVLEALRTMLTPRAIVRRGGRESQIDAAALVPGDLVVLAAGGCIPADLRLLETRELRVDESALTGESSSVAKGTTAVDETTPLAERSPMAWTGTVVTGGRALGLVAATGMETEFGRIARLTASVERETTPLQVQLAALGKQLGAAGLSVAAVVGLVGVLLGRDPLAMFMTGVSLAVAIVPEGLPAVVTVTLALGVRAMTRRRALLRRLQAAETLGAATVVCTDKTGTLTQNEMTVQRIELAAASIDVTGVGYSPAGELLSSGTPLDPTVWRDVTALLETGLVCNHARIVCEDGAWRHVGEPTEASLVAAARKAGVECGRDTIVMEVPFSSERKRMTVVTDGSNGRMAHVKGAPELIVSRATSVLEGGVARPMTTTDRARVEARQRALAEQGLRTLALARRRPASDEQLDANSLERELTLLGIVGIMDPPRPEVSSAIGLARTAGIRVIMITGDAPATAVAIGRQVGLEVARALTGPELETLDDAQLDDALQGEVVFARTTPEHKLRIMARLQAQGHVAAMTGDGVNDAPALKKADVGIAMGVRGTDVAKSAADVVLTDDNFASIVSAVEEGRRQYDNIRKFVRYLLSSNTAEVLAIVLNLGLGGSPILVPVQILWMNLVTDGVTAVALGLEPVEPDAMHRPPRRRDEPILGRTGLLVVLLLGGYMGLATLGLFESYIGSADPREIARAQTMAFTGIVVLEKVNVLNFRCLGSPVARIGFFTNPWLLVAVVGTLGLQVAAVYVPFLQGALHTVPLVWSDWLLMLTVAAPIFFLTESAKWWCGRRSSWPRAHEVAVGDEA